MSTFLKWIIKAEYKLSCLLLQLAAHLVPVSLTHLRPLVSSVKNCLVFRLHRSLLAIQWHGSSVYVRCYLADHLVKHHGKTFRDAYQTTAMVVNYAEKNNKKLNELSLKELQKIEPCLKSNVLNIFDLKNSVNSKKSFGGTSFNNIKKMILKYKKIYK